VHTNSLLAERNIAQHSELSNINVINPLALTPSPFPSPSKEERDGVRGSRVEIKKLMGLY
jgi:hypothetical protein